MGLPHDHKAILVDRMLASSYDIVRMVAENIDAVKNLGGDLDKFDAIYQAIGVINTVNTNLTVIQTVEAALAQIVPVGSNIPAITALNTNLSVLTTLYSKLADLDNIAADIAAIETLLPYTDTLIEVGEGMPAVQGVYNKLTELQSIYDNMATILANAQTLASVETRLAALEALGSGVSAEDVGIMIQSAVANKAEASALTGLADRVLSNEGAIGNLSGALANHTHGITGVTGLQGALDGKAPVNHGHAIGEVTGLQNALDSKQPAGAYAASVHNHDDRYYTETEILQTLSGYAQANHTHSTYVQGVRLGAAEGVSGGVAKAGYVITSVVPVMTTVQTGETGGENPNPIYLTYMSSLNCSQKPLQRQINGVWATITG